MNDNLTTESRQSVLIIEHDVEVLDLLTQLIISWGFDAVATRELFEAEELIRADPPDLIVFDVSRPKMNGLQTVHGWKTDFFTAHIPVIVLLEKRQFRKRMLEIKRGVDDYLIKPPDPIDLHVRIEMALRRSEHQFFASALTRLPGGRVLERQIVARIAAGEPLTVIFLDIDNFNAFYDTYSYL